MTPWTLTLTAPRNFLSKNYVWHIFGSDFSLSRRKKGVWGSLPQENAENLENADDENAENADDWPYDDWRPLALGAVHNYRYRYRGWFSGSSIHCITFFSATSWWTTNLVCRCHITIALDVAFFYFRRTQLVLSFRFWLPQKIQEFNVYHYTQKDYRTELYYFRIIFGNSCSVITEPICFWN